MKIGAQWFTNRNYLTTNEGIEQAFKKTKELGYDCAQYSGAPNGGDFDPTFLKEMIDKYSLPITLTHISFDKICNNLDEEIEKHKAIGCCNIGLGAMPNGAANGVEELDKFIAKLNNEIIPKIEDGGCKFFYHNHSFEFTRLDNGALIMDYLMENCQRLNLTLDTHWVHRGGVNVVDYIEKCKGRIECVHLKDYKMNMWDVKFAPVGKGNLDWTKILPAFEKAGVKYAFVEQDDAPDLGEPFDRLKESREFLTKMGY